ncbi:stimulated by retinoic acid gene 6 protein-like [Discoglossus pictus]
MGCGEEREEGQNQVIHHTGEKEGEGRLEPGDSSDRGEDGEEERGERLEPGNSPLDLLGTFSNRWTFGLAFGAIANTLMSLICGQYLPKGIPTWAQASIEVGVSYYPIFVCHTTNNKIIGSVIGFFYTLAWLAGTTVHIVGCPYELINFNFNKIIVYWPSMLSLTFLVVDFFCMFIKSCRMLRAGHVSEENCFLQVHQAEHVKRLFKKHVNNPKSWFQRKIYAWDPCFKFPSRMVGTAVLALFCLYIFATIQFAGYVFIINQLKSYEDVLSQTELNHSVRYLTEFKDALNGFPVMLLVLVLIGILFVYTFVYPIKHGEVKATLEKWMLVFLIYAIVYIIIKVQVYIAAKFFLQKKTTPDDKHKLIALDNRKAYHNFNYFILIYNVFLGLGDGSIRLLLSIILGTCLVARIDRSILQRGFESFDSGYNTWIGMIYMDHYHTNPVLLSFCNILLTTRADKIVRESNAHFQLSNATGPHVTSRALTRWLLFYTLLKNPRLIINRKVRELADPNTNDSVFQTRLFQASVMEAGMRKYETLINANCKNYKEE